MAQALADLHAENYAALYVLHEPEMLGLVTVSREPSRA
jgi:hypothetical protein